MFRKYLSPVGIEAIESPSKNTIPHETMLDLSREDLPCGP